jgi:hypothetical protein
MYRSGMTGLGLLETTATGVRSVSTPTCVTQAELDEANAKCPVQQIRGLGAHGSIAMAPMSGRLAAFSPCDIAGLSTCPGPTCIDEYTAGLIAQCIAGTQANPDFPCDSLMVYALAQLPYCSRPNALQPVPSCLSKDMVTGRDYCKAHPKFDGPNKGMNALCWVAMHDPAYWSQMMAAPACPTYVPPTLRDAPPKAPPPPPPPPAAPPALETQQQSAATMGMWGILALLAVGGGGYYMYRKYKR